MDRIRQASDRILVFLDKCMDEAFGWSRAELSSKIGLDESEARIALSVLEREQKIDSVVHEHVVYYGSRRAEVEAALADLVRQGKAEVVEGPDGEPLYRAKAGPLRRLWHRIRGARR